MVGFGFIIINILVTCDYIASVTKVVVHERDMALFHGWNRHLVTNKNTVVLCIRDMSGWCCLW